MAFARFRETRPSRPLFFLLCWPAHSPIALSPPLPTPSPPPTQTPRSPFQEASTSKKTLVLVAGPHPNHHANAAVLCGIFSVILLGRDADRSYAPLAALEPLVPFRDPSSGPSTFHLTAKHVIAGIHRAKTAGILDDWSDPSSTFDADEYDHYEAVENGDLNWILPGKLLAFSGPSPSPRVVYGYKAHVPEDYWAYFKAKGVTAVVRLNRALYDGRRFADGGFSMHELYFPDGSCPPEPLLARFLELAEGEPGALAIHCKAGLGRTGVLICSYLIKHFGFSAEEAIGYIRVVRPGSVIGLQQNYLLAHASRLQEEGRAFRAAAQKEKEIAAAASAAAAGAAAATSSSSRARRRSIDLSVVAGPAVEAPRAPLQAPAAASSSSSQPQQPQQQQQPQTRASRLASLLRGVAAAAGSLPSRAPPVAPEAGLDSAFFAYHFLVGTEEQADAAAALDAAGWRLHASGEPSPSSSSSSSPSVSVSSPPPPPSSSSSSSSSSLEGGYNRWFRWPADSTARKRNITEHFDQGVFLFFDQELEGHGGEERGKARPGGGGGGGGGGRARGPQAADAAAAAAAAGGACRGGAAAGGWEVKRTGPRFSFAFSYLRRAQPRKVTVAAAAEAAEGSGNGRSGTRTRSRG